MSNYDSSTCCFCKSNKYNTCIKGPIVEIFRCSECGLMRLCFIWNKGNYSFTGYAGSSERYKLQRMDKERIQIRDYNNIIQEKEA